MAQLLGQPCNFYPHVLQRPARSALLSALWPRMVHPPPSGAACAFLADHYKCRGSYRCIWHFLAGVFLTTNVPDSHTDKVPGAPVPGILSDYTVMVADGGRMARPGNVRGHLRRVDDAADRRRAAGGAAALHVGVSKVSVVWCGAGVPASVDIVAKLVENCMLQKWSRVARVRTPRLVAPGRVCY